MAHALIITPGEEGGQPTRTACLSSALSAEGWRTSVVDLSRAEFPKPNGRAYDVIVLVLMDFPALSKAAELIAEIRGVFPAVRIILYGEYAKLNAPMLREQFDLDVVQSLTQDEDELIRILTGKQYKRSVLNIVPDRSQLPPLEEYGMATIPGGEKVIQGNLESSRGCHHRCRYCSVEALYSGKQSRVTKESVLADARQQWLMGARHFYFVDADFFSFPKPAMELARQLHEELPESTFEVVTRVDHINELGLKSLKELRQLGLVRVTSALEFPDNHVLERIDKGFTVDDVESAIELCRQAEIELKPTFLTFTPWVSLQDVLCVFPAFLQRTGLQYTTPIDNRFTRLLLYKGSPLVERNPEVRAVCNAEEELQYEWNHPDGAVDELYARIATDGRCCPRC